MKNRIHVGLRILEFECEPNQLTALLNTEPSRIWRKGDAINQKGALHHKENGWVLASGLNEYAEFNQHIESLIDIIRPNIDRFAEICSRYYTEVSCAIYMYYGSEESAPWLHLEKEQMKFFSNINAEVDFDLYLL